MGWHASIGHPWGILGASCSLPERWPRFSRQDCAGLFQVRRRLGPPSAWATSVQGVPAGDLVCGTDQNTTAADYAQAVLCDAVSPKYPRRSPSPVNLQALDRQTKLRCVAWPQRRPWNTFQMKLYQKVTFSNNIGCDKLQCHQEKAAAIRAERLGRAEETQRCREERKRQK